MSQRPKLLPSLVAVLVFSCAVAARADIVTASGAGPLPSSAQDLTGLNVTQIVGDLDFPLGVDMFKIDITDFADFSAITTGVSFGVPDTELFLFDAGGLGVYANDDASGSNTLSCLPSADSSNPCSSTRPVGVGPTTDGTYYLAITRSANGPLSVAGEIFSSVSSTDVVGPDLTMGGGSPIVDWDNNVFTSPDFDLTAFNITLTGTSPVPEPATWSLFATGLVLVLLRRKRLAPGHPSLWTRHVAS
jgi:hypothetical protein